MPSLSHIFVYIYFWKMCKPFDLHVLDPKRVDPKRPTRFQKKYVYECVNDKDQKYHKFTHIFFSLYFNHATISIH